jgi:CheY-like chemotaxis protein
MKILIVDDQQEHLLTMVDHLESLLNQYSLLTANNPHIAYNIATREIPDLIITDWEMPEISGIELINLIKQNPITKDIFIIMATGVMMKPEDLELALASGAVDFIRKPIDKIELTARVGSVLQLANTFNELKRSKEFEKRILEEKLEDQKTINRLQNEKMQAKDKELLLFTTSLASKNEILSNICQKLKKIDFSKAENFRKMIQCLTNEIDFCLKNEDNWTNFILYFNQVHELFFSKLNDRFPNLTSYDVKFCALIRLKLSIGDIANILNITYQSAETSRTRIRKKIHIPSDLNLEKFICSI